jgi:lipid-A-disaccharide synthase
MTSVLISAGDASGEAHAAGLVPELRKALPGVQLRGLGGPEMNKAGVDLIAHQEELAIGGIFEVVRDLRRVLATYGRMRRALRDGSPDLLILVDSPDFNLPLAGAARRAGVPVLYYISPQIWAWRAYRIRKIAKRVDRMCVIFPFEKTYYADRGMEVDFVGHPLVDRTTEGGAEGLARESERQAERQSIRRELEVEDGAPLVLLLPGSRRNEIAQHLDAYLDAARELARRRPETRFALGVASSLEAEPIISRVRAAQERGGPRVAVWKGRTAELVGAADLALSKPGTMTLELALRGTPTIVAGRIHAASAFLLRYGSDVWSFALPNIVAGEELIPEFLQEDMRPERIALALDAFLEGPLALRQKRRFADIARALGAGGAAAHTAAIAAGMVNGTVRT